MITDFEKEFNLLEGYEILKNENLSSRTFTKTGGVVEYFFIPKNIEQLIHIVKLIHKYHVPYFILGNGSNILFTDSYMKGIIISLEKIRKIEVKNKTELIAYAGERIIDASQFATKENLSGLEFACGIPGSVGGAVFMNAGAYHGQMKDVVSKVEYLDQNGNVCYLANNELNFEYRHSFFTDNEKCIILSVHFKLQEGNREEIENTVKHLTYLRESKQPLEYPSCGSVFKRPDGFFAGKLIQDSNLQGVRIGGIEVSKKHAGFMVNIDNGTTTDYVDLIHHVQQKVKELHGVTLETEVRIINAFH